MTHVRELIHRSLEGELVPAERTRLDEHLRNCDACRDLENELRTNDALLAARERLPGVPPRRMRPARTIRLAPVLLGGAMLLIALLAGAQLREWRSQPTGAATSQPLPSPVALAPAWPDPRFGFVSSASVGMAVRPETSDEWLATVSGVSGPITPSPNGRLVAYWTGGNWTLHLYDTVDRRVRTADLYSKEGESPRAVIWSTDGLGLLVHTGTPPTRGLGRTPEPLHETWVRIDLATQTITPLPTAISGSGLQPLAWDRPAGIIYAARTSEDETTTIGAFPVDGGQSRQERLEHRQLVGIDHAARSAVLLAQTTCANGDPRCWVAEFRDLHTFAMTHRLNLTKVPDSPPRLFLRPRSNDLLVAFRTGQVDRVELWTSADADAGRPLAKLPQLDQVLFRPDGGAVFLLQFDSSGGGRWHGKLVSLMNEDISDFEIRGGGNPAASVVLDASFAFALEGRPPATPTPAVVPGDASARGVCAGARSDALAPWSSGVIRADRVEVKRMSAQDLERGTTAFPVRVTWRDAASTFLCVVAVGGELQRPDGGIIAGPREKWGVFVSVAGSNASVGRHYGSEGDWPAYIDGLPNRMPLSGYPGYVTEIVDENTIRVNLESPMMSQEFGNPTTVRADRFTAITPSAATLGATDVKVGDFVQVFFEREGRDAATGAYPLSIFRIVSRAQASATSSRPPALGRRVGPISLGDTAESVRAALGVPDRDWLPGDVTPEWLYKDRFIVRLGGTRQQPGTIWQFVAYVGATAEGFAIGADKDAFRRTYAAYAITSRVRGWEGASGPIDQLEVSHGDVTLIAEFAPEGRARAISLRRVEPVAPTPVPTPRTLPPAAPPSCPGTPAPSAPQSGLLRTNPGWVTTRVARDESWSRPALVPPQFLMWSSSDEPAYQAIICHSVYAYGYGNSEGSKLLLAFDPLPQGWPQPVDWNKPASIDNPTPGLGLQLWLMDVHLLDMSADANGVVTVQLERRPGFEWVVFDLEAVAVSPHPAGSLMFRFVDSSGLETLPPIVRPVRASWELGR